MEFQVFPFPEGSDSGRILLSSCFLYFNTGQGEDSTGESAYYPFSSLVGIDPVSSTSLDLFFKSKYIDAFDTVRLTITSGKHKEVTHRIIKEGINVAGYADSLNYLIKPIIDKDSGFVIMPEITNVSITLATACCNAVESDDKGRGDIVYASGRYYIPFTHTEIQPGPPDRYLGGTAALGDGYITNDVAVDGFYSKVIPLGYKCVGAIVYGAGTSNRWKLSQGILTLATMVAKTTDKAPNVEGDITTDGNTDFAGDGLATAVIIINMLTAADKIYGGKIYLERV